MPNGSWAKKCSRRSENQKWRTGRDTQVPPAIFDFYIAFNLFRLASILQGVAARARLGNASSEHAVEAGSLTRPIAELGWAQASRVH